MSREELFKAHERSKPAPRRIVYDDGSRNYRSSTVRTGDLLGPSSLPADRMKVYFPRSGGRILLAFSVDAYTRLWTAAGRPGVFGYQPRITEDGTLYLRPAHKVLKHQGDDPSWRPLYQKCGSSREGTTFTIEQWTFEVCLDQQPNADTVRSWLADPGPDPEVVEYLLDELGYVALALPLTFIRKR